jgi:hypothetical protein
MRGRFRRAGNLYWSAEREAGEGWHEEISARRGQREEVDKVLLHKLHQLVLVGLRQQLRVVLAEVVGEEEEVLPEGWLLIRGVQLLAQQLDVLGRRADKVYGVEVRLHGAGALDAVEEKHPARDGVSRSGARSVHWGVKFEANKCESRGSARAGRGEVGGWGRARGLGGALVLQQLALGERDADNADSLLVHDERLQALVRIHHLCHVVAH